MVLTASAGQGWIMMDDDNRGGGGRRVDVFGGLMQEPTRTPNTGQFWWCVQTHTGRDAWWVC